MNQIVSFFTGHPFFNQLEHDTLAVNEAKGRVHVADHILRENCQVFDNVAKAIEHVVDEYGGVRRNNALS